jgi:transposase
MALDFTAEQLQGFPPEAQAIIRALAAEVKRLNARVAELEAQLGKTPQNSSLPPSSQHPHAKPPPRKPKSKRQRGGQRGHKKHARELIPTEQGDRVETLKPQVTEYQLHRLLCACGTTTCAPLPPGVPRDQSGPRLIAFTALLMAYCRQSKRRTAEFLGTLLNQPCCPALPCGGPGRRSSSWTRPCSLFPSVAVPTLRRQS